MTDALHPPAEWTPHSAIWTAMPADASIWPGHFEAAQEEVAAMVRLLARPHPYSGIPGDSVKLLVHGDAARAAAERLLKPKEAELIEAAYGDTWLRDTGPIFHDPFRCSLFRFNGWGGKYIYEHDDTVGAAIAIAARADARRVDLVLEGGAIDWDGEGTVLTTRECLLNPNRNVGADEAMMEGALGRLLGMQRVIWLGEGLRNDHTDGHVDNIARFVAPGVVVCMAPAGSDDPNADRLDAIARELEAARDARGRKLQVVRIPSPGRVTGDEGEIVPASHMNFIIGNASVVVPTYDTPSADDAVAALQKLFPGRDVVGSSARHILTGGGAFHCITQQQPA